jgi:quercetin dioxygenase-like cupin family protein
MASYTAVDVDQLPGEGPGGAVRKVRRALALEAFGINHFTLPAGVRGREHDERDSGQEEVVLVLSGAGELEVDGDTLELRPGRFVRLSPEARRCPIAGSEGLVFVTIGSPPGSYTPPPWG